MEAEGQSPHVDLGDEYRRRSRRIFLHILLASTLLLLATLASLSIGPTGGISPLNFLKGDPIAEVRAIRTLAGLASGAILGAVGLALQTVLRNPLVDPYILGVSSGAFLGSLAYIALDLPLGPVGLFLGGFTGGMVALLATYGLSRASGFGALSIVLSGVAVGMMASSLAALLIFVYEDRLGLAVALMFGSLAYTGPGGAVAMVPALAFTLAWLVLRRTWLSHYLVGEDYAASRGVPVERLKKEAFLATAVGVGSVSSLLGPIGFVGLIGPHLARLAAGGEPGATLVLSLLASPLILLAGDVAARSLLSPQEVPVGVFTSLLGAPFFLYLLVSTGRSR